MYPGNINKWQINKVWITFMVNQKSRKTFTRWTWTACIRLVEWKQNSIRIRWTIVGGACGLYRYLPNREEIYRALIESYCIWYKKDYAVIARIRSQNSYYNSQRGWNCREKFPFNADLCRRFELRNPHIRHRTNGCTLELPYMHLLLRVKI